MLFNRIRIRIGDNGSRMASPIRPRKRGRDDRVTEHGLVSRPKYTGMWDNSINNWRLALGAMLRPSAAVLQDQHLQNKSKNLLQMQ